MGTSHNTIENPLVLKSGEFIIFFNQLCFQLYSIFVSETIFN